MIVGVTTIFLIFGYFRYDCVLNNSLLPNVRTYTKAYSVFIDHQKYVFAVFLFIFYLLMHCAYSIEVINLCTKQSRRKISAPSQDTSLKRGVFGQKVYRKVVLCTQQQRGQRNCSGFRNMSNKMTTQSTEETDLLTHLVKDAFAVEKPVESMRESYSQIINLSVFSKPDSQEIYVKVLGSQEYFLSIRRTSVNTGSNDFVFENLDFPEQSRIVGIWKIFWLWVF